MAKIVNISAPRSDGAPEALRRWKRLAISYKIKHTLLLDTYPGELKICVRSKTSVNVLVALFIMTKN